MSRNVILSETASPRTFAWPLELEVELCAAGGCDVTGEHLRTLTALLNDVVGVRQATAEAHSHANLIRVCVTVDAYDLHDALDRVSAVVRDRVDQAGLGPAILVAARAAAARPASRRRPG